MRRLSLLLVLMLVGCSGQPGDATAGGEVRTEQSTSSAAARGTASTISAAAQEGAASLVVAPLASTTVVLPVESTTAGQTEDATKDATAATTTPTSTSTTTAPTTATSAPTTTPAPNSTTEASPMTTGDGSNPIAVPVAFLADATSSGAARCKSVDLHTVNVPANPGYRGETLGSQQLSGDQLWAISWYLTLYANCERQARGLEPFSAYSADKQLAMQQTVLGINTSHGGFGQRADIAGGLAAEGHGGGPLTGEVMPNDSTEDDDGNGLWSASEIARRSASGNQDNDGAGLVDHGDAMTSTRYSCIFAAASLGPSEDHRVDIIIFYGSRC